VNERLLAREALADFAAARRADFERWLAELVEIPTVSADPARRADVARGAEAAAARLRAVGATAEVIETGGHPLVYGRLEGDPGWPVVTLYNHMDVQPADGDAWRTDPFRLTTKGDRYYGRGATDDKGPALTALLGALAAREAGVPLGFAFLWEFEEEVGSAHFEATLARRRERMATDSVVVSDTVWITRGKPSSPAGLRGMVTFRLLLETAEADMHSGMVGGAARNPVAELMQVVAACVDGRTGEVLIPGFYDDVTPLTEAEARDFLASGFSVETFVRDHGIRSLRTTEPIEVMRRIWARPTLEVHGVVGGYTGPGVKAIVPPRAEVKLSCRLVPEMTTAKTMTRVQAFIRARFPDVTVEVGHGLEPFRGQTTGPYADAIRDAYRFAFGEPPVFTREGGSIGAVPTMARLLGTPVLFLGLSLPEHGYHAPNEHYDWEQASGGVAAFARYFATIARLPGRRR
jgi:acetylornithine deacetylase/succinyl-diaminopimelate desuccinylase-like protein